MKEGVLPSLHLPQKCFRCETFKERPIKSIQKRETFQQEHQQELELHHGTENMENMFYLLLISFIKTNKRPFK